MQETFEVAGDRRRDICRAVQDHDHRSCGLQLCTRQESRHHRVDVSTVNLRRFAVDRGLAYGNTTAFQPSSEGRPESRRRLIRRLERHPGDRSLCLCAPGPGHDKHCLSSARRGTDQGQRSRDAPFKLFEQAWTFQGTLEVPWDGESLRHQIHLRGNSCPACLRLHATAALRGSKTQPRRTHTEESHPSGSRPDRSSSNSQHLCATPYKGTTRCLVGYWLTVSTGTGQRTSRCPSCPATACVRPPLHKLCHVTRSTPKIGWSVHQGPAVRPGRWMARDRRQQRRSPTARTRPEAALSRRDRPRT